MKPNNKQKMRLLPAADVAIFCEQLVLILKSAIPLHEGVVAMYENLPDKKARIIIKQLADSLENNNKLHIALEEAHIFPNYMVKMVKIGEATGKLEYVLTELAGYYEREYELKNRVKSAILYPSVLVAMMGIVLTILIVTVIPIFERVYQGMGTQMSSAAEVFLKVGVSIGKYAYIALLVILFAVIILLLVNKTKNGARIVNFTLSHLFFTKKISQNIAAARFASVMGMMFSTGYNIEEALGLSHNIVSDEVVKTKIKHVQERTKEGVSFSKSIKEVNIFTGLYPRMISIGEKTGNLDIVLMRLAKRISKNVDDKIDGTIAFIEPLLIGSLCFVIGVIMLTIMIPLISIMSSIV